MAEILEPGSKVFNYLKVFLKVVSTIARQVSGHWFESRSRLDNFLTN